MESWATFATVVGAAAAGLTGLLFVAVSIRADVIAKSVELRNRAAQTLSLFVTVLLTAIVLAIPGQDYGPLGAELITLAVVLGGVVQYPWYDAMFFPLLALWPASRLDAWLVGRTTLISILLLPGVGISQFQYQQARLAVPFFTACFLICAQLEAGRGGEAGGGRCWGRSRRVECGAVRACAWWTWSCSRRSWRCCSG